MSDKEKVEIATNVTTIVTTLEGAAIINRATALKELRQSSEITGMFTSITDDDITEAENEPPEPGEDDGVPPPIAPEQDDLVDQDEAGEGGAGAAREPAEARSAGASERGKAGAKDRARPRSRARTRDGDDFSESDHPRGKGGQFAKGSGGGSARTEKTLHGPDKAKAALKDWKARTPYTDVEDLLAVTPANQSHLEKAGALISEATKAVFKTPGQKKPEGAREKMERKKYASAAELTDLARGGFTAETPEQADHIVSELKKHYDIIDEGWGQSQTGYVDRKVMVRFDNGQVGEVQVWEPSFYKAKNKEGGHDAYEDWRKMPDHSTPEALALEDKQRALYAAASARAAPVWAGVLPGKAG